MARSNYPTVPTSPPRLTGDKTRDILALLSWQQDFYRITVQEQYFASTETVTETSSGLTESLSLPQSDALAFVKNDTDGTKRLRFDASQIATGTTRVLSMPNSDVDLGADFAAASHVGSGGAAHAAAGGSAGFMSATDKSKLDGIEALADVTDEGTVTAAFPLVDTTALVYDPVDDTKLVRIDVGAVATLTTRVITMPDQNVDLTPGATFEAADATILKAADIGVTVQAFDANLTFDDVAETISQLWTFGAGIDLASSALSVDGTQVVGARRTGWTAATGTAARTTWATFAGQTITNPPTQTEVQNIDDHMVILSQRLKALTDDLITHGLIGT